jgi:hypothetical protein
MKPETTRKRLLLLADFLEKLPPEKAAHFNMHTWFELGRELDNGELFEGTFEQLCKKKKLGDCGTSACALGWGTQVPELNKAGLTIKAVDEDADAVIDKVFGDGADLDLADGEFSHNELFHDTKIKTPKEWATRCRAWVAKNLPWAIPK